MPYSTRQRTRKAEESNRAVRALEIVMQGRDLPLQRRTQHVEAYARLSLAHPRLYEHGERNRHAVKVGSSIRIALEKRLREKALLDQNIDIVMNHLVHLHLFRRMNNPTLYDFIQISAVRDPRTLSITRAEIDVEALEHDGLTDEEHFWQNLDDLSGIYLDIEYIEDDNNGNRIYEVLRRDNFGAVRGPANTVKSTLRRFLGGRYRYRFTDVYLFRLARSRFEEANKVEIPIAR